MLRPFAVLPAVIVAAMAALAARDAAPDVSTSRQERPVAIFATRHPDTADTGGPYRVTFRQIAGTEVTGGRIEFVVAGPGGAPRVTDRALLRPGNDDRSWEADLPGQPAGSTITYHAVFVREGGEEIRHPSRAPAAYRFRIVTLRRISLSLPGARDLEREQASMELVVEASAPPTGSAVVRLLDPEGSATLPGRSSTRPARDERRIPLAVRRRGAAADRFEMKCDLPPPAPGGMIDFYVETRLPSGEMSRIPADAPARVFTLKRSITPVRRIVPGRAFVLDVAAVGRERWVGLQGGGLQVVDPGGRSRSFDSGSGLLSSVARFILPDLAAGQVYVGTGLGSVAIDAEGDGWVAIGPPRPSAWSMATSHVPRGGWRQRAGPGALSTLDGTLLFQIQEQAAGGEASGPASLVRLADDRMTITSLPAPEMPLVGLSFAGFDPSGGCWLFGGYMRRGRRGLRPAVMESCDGTDRPIAVVTPDSPGGPWSVERVVALVREPATGGLVAAVEMLTASGDAPERRPGYGVFGVDLGSGRLTSLDPALDLLDVEITAVAADRPRGRLLIGTVGRGILTLSSAEAGARVEGLDGITAGITALRAHDPMGAILIGTMKGAFELPADGGSVRPIGAGGDGPGLADALPMDVDRATGRVLLSSHFEGLVHLAPAASGQWTIAAHQRPGREIPDGRYGDADYGSTGRLAAIMRSRGLLILEGGEARLLDPEDGLTGTLLLRVVALSNGDIWVTHSPLPFGSDPGATLQRIRDDRVERTVPIMGRDLATIARLVEAPEGDSLLAATRAGLIAIDPDGDFERLSSHAASSVAVDRRTGAIGVVGSQVERRRDDGRFEPVLFAVRHPRWPASISPEGAPVDLAIARDGTWFILYSGGLVALVHPERGFLGVLDTEDGIPPTAHRMLAHPGTGEIFLGSSDEGPVVLGPTAAPETRRPAPGDGTRYDG